MRLGHGAMDMIYTHTVSDFKQLEHMMQTENEATNFEWSEAWRDAAGAKTLQNQGYFSLSLSAI